MLSNCGAEEDSWESLDCRDIKPVNPKGKKKPWIFIGRTDAEAEAPRLWPPDAKSWLIGKDPVAGKDWRQEEKGSTEDEMLGWYHQLDRREFEQTLGDSEGQKSLECWSPWGHKELDTAQWQNKNILCWAQGRWWKRDREDFSLITGASPPLVSILSPSSPSLFCRIYHTGSVGPKVCVTLPWAGHSSGQRNWQSRKSSCAWLYFACVCYSIWCIHLKWVTELFNVTVCLSDAPTQIPHTVSCANTKRHWQTVSTWLTIYDL